MFDFNKFCEEFEKADEFTVIKGLAISLSQATNEIEKVIIIGHLFDAVDVAEAGNKAMRDHCNRRAEQFFEEHKKNIELKKKLEVIQKAAST